MATGSGSTRGGVGPTCNSLSHRAGNRAIVRRGFRVSLIVGTLLTLINEGPTVLAGHPELSLIPRAVLNYIVPFCVSCYSAGAARSPSSRHRSRRSGDSGRATDGRDPYR